VKQSLINKIALCDHCGHAFTMNIEGDEVTCDSCLSEKELNSQLIDEGVLKEYNYVSD
jgi:hypothetical protein